MGALEETKAVAQRGRRGYGADMYEAYPGKMALADGRLVSAVFTLGDDVLTISAEGITVGTWPLKYCRLAPEADGAFRVVVDGEPTVFRPTDPNEFGKVAAQRFRASPLSDRINVMRRMPPAVDVAAPGDTESEPSARFLDLPRLPIVAGLSVLAVLLLVAFAGFDTGGVESSESDVVQNTPDTTVAIQPAVSDEPEVFSLTAAAFTDRWNTLAMTTPAAPIVRPALPEPGDPGFELPVGPGVTLQAALDDDGTVAEYTVTVRTSEIVDQEDIGRAVASMGVAIGLAEPDSTSSDWIVLLNRLGLQQDLNFTDVDQQVERDGVQFYLFYASMADSLVLSIAPS